MKEKYVWEFTNQRKLTKKNFIKYFEKKVFQTVRKYEMLPKNKKITIRKGNDLNTLILEKILKTKFEVKYSSKPNFSSENLSKAAEETFQNILLGKFKGPKPKDNVSRPLYFHSDKEIKLYAKLTEIKRKEIKRNPKIQNLFKKFLKKNQDLEINVVKALDQIQN